MHNFGGRFWLSAALTLLLGLSSPLTWLAQSAPRALPCCCPQSAPMAMAAPCCHVEGAPAPAPLTVALLAPARTHFSGAHKVVAPAIVASPEPPRFCKLARVFPAEVALPPPISAPVRTGSCRAPPLSAEIRQRFKKEGNTT